MWPLKPGACFMNCAEGARGGALGKKIDICLTHRRASVNVFQNLMTRPARASQRPRATGGVGGGAKRKGDQVIENKQFREIALFRSPMISRTYDPRREPARFVLRKIAFAFAVFPARRGPKRNGREIDGGSRGGWRATL